MNAAEAHAFITRWLQAVSSHDLERIMSFYAPDAVVESPMVVKIMHEPSGRIAGHAALQRYFGRGLPTYKPQLIEATYGVSSVLAWYANNRGTRTCTYFELGPDGKITRNVSHYNE